MGIIVKEIKNNKIHFFIKGSDDVIIKRVVDRN